MKNRKANTEEGGRRRARLALGALGLACGSFLLTGALADGQAVEDARSALEKWVETRRVLSQEKRDWALGKELLEERIDLVQREIESLRARIGEAEESIAEADEKRAGLFDENERLKRASSGLAGTVASLEERTADLLRRSPEPIRERVRPLSQRFPEDPDDTRLSLGERFQNVVGVLNEVNKFQREVTVTSEVRDLGGGTTAEVTALYLGLGQGYYASADGSSAGVGAPGPGGWTWSPANDSAAAISEAIAILKNERVAEFVQLPIHVD